MSVIKLIAAASLLLDTTCVAQEAKKERVQAFGLTWLVDHKEDWKWDGSVLSLLTPRPSTQPRRPAQYALAETKPYLRVIIELEAMPEPKADRNRRNSLMLAYAWRDIDHFNYVHLSVDSAKQAAVHNGIFHVYGGDRVRMSSDDGPATLQDGQWHKIRMVYDGTTGTAECWVDGKTSPSLKAVDLSLGAGMVGIGSFFDKGAFRNLKIIEK
ncbi:MAG: hypothetical protein HYZ37_14670 [Candidatus Solibacter usitatus]|nr:hypothetical protein [Candidatus Solibacter usitatus]